jgi:hypothetical protein
LKEGDMAKQVLDLEVFVSHKVILA